MKKILSLMILCLITPFSLLVSESYLEMGIDNINGKAMDTLISKAKAVYKMEKMLVSLIQLNMDAEDYYDTLRTQQSKILSIFSFTQELYDVKYPIKKRDKRWVHYKGGECWAYYNICDFAGNYERELDNFNRHQLVTIEKLNEQTLNALASGLSYNFILTLDKEVSISPNTIRIKDGLETVHFTANHALLSRNQPVITAGELVIYKHRGKYLCFIANATGHYQTETSSLVHMSDYLNQLGIPREAIFEISVPVRKLNALCVDLLHTNHEEPGLIEPALIRETQ